MQNLSKIVDNSKQEWYYINNTKRERRFLMDIKIMSRVGALNHEPKENSFIIRVADNVADHHDLPATYKGELRLGFYDVVSVQGLPSNWHAFSVEDADQVLAFFDEVDKANAEELIIHCHQGISRSAAIAVSYGYIHKDKELLEAIENGPYVPNIRVITSILNQAGIWKSHRAEIRNKYSQE